MADRGGGQGGSSADGPDSLGPRSRPRRSCAHPLEALHAACLRRRARVTGRPGPAAARPSHGVSGGQRPATVHSLDPPGRARLAAHPLHGRASGGGTEARGVAVSENFIDGSASPRQQAVRGKRFTRRPRQRRRDPRPQPCRRYRRLSGRPCTHARTRRQRGWRGRAGGSDVGAGRNVAASLGPAAGGHPARPWIATMRRVPRKR